MQCCPLREHDLSLRKLLPEAEFAGVPDIAVRACSCDSRTVRPGDLFVAIRGVVHDGHDFIPQAVARGCAAVLAQSPVPNPGCPVCYVPDTRAAYGRLCQALAGDPSRHMKVIGITGTNGKTTSTFLTASVLAAAGHNVGVLGTLGCFDGLRCSKQP